MMTAQVMVTKYIACDDQEFITCSECEAHEREVRNLVEHQLYELRCEKRKVRFAINEARIKARIARLDAENQKAEAMSAMGKSKYCTLMSDYWQQTSAYNAKRREMFELRRKIGIATDRLYMWFGLHKKKSLVAKLERRRRSEEWRKANTPDKWRTPNKIRVSELPHPARGED